MFTVQVPMAAPAPEPVAPMAPVAVPVPVAPPPPQMTELQAVVPAGFESAFGTYTLPRPISA